MALTTVVRSLFVFPEGRCASVVSRARPFALPFDHRHDLFLIFHSFHPLIIGGQLRPSFQNLLLESDCGCIDWRPLGLLVLQAVQAWMDCR